MKPSPRILVVGPGAVGRLLAARWAERGVEVYLLGRTAEQERLFEAHGITLSGRHGARRTVRRIRGARGAAPRCDAGFFCVKAADLLRAFRSASPYLKDDGIAVALQNGIGHERVLRAAAGPARTVIGSCYFGARVDGPTGVSHEGGHGLMLASARGNTPAADGAARLLRKAGWRVSVQRDELRMLWSKVAFNAAINLLGAAAGASSGELVADPSLRRVLMTLAAEAERVARASGHAPLFAVPAAVDRGCRASPGQINSTLQDLRAGRPLELPAITRPLLREARRRGVDVPAVRVLTRVVERLGRKAARARREARARGRA